jgi:type IX secretion system PorP/SprF family membrane protein
MKKLAHIIILIFAFVEIKAQDPHWSMIQWNPIYLNPANSGFANKANRLTALYRNQWRAAPVPYNTPLLSYDRKLVQSDNGFILGIGAQLMFDRAGDGKLSTFRPALSLAVGKNLNSEKQNISIGIQTSYVRKQLNFNNLNFGSQFNGSQYDPNLANGENLANDNAGYFDLGIGFNFTSKIKKSGKIDLGVSAFNLTKPNYNFLQNSETSVGQRVLTYIKSDIPVGKANKWAVNPAVFYQFQQKNQEALIQTLATVKLKKSDAKNSYKLSFGPGYRWNDAIIAYTALQWNDLKVGFAFDGNISDFKSATNGRGAYEIMLNYEWEKNKKKKEEPIAIIDTTKEEEEIVEEEIVNEDTTFTIPEIVENTQPVVIELPAKPIEPDMNFEKELKQFLPIQLFFDNDKPKPTTTLPIESIEYDETYRKYKERQAEFIKNKGDETLLFFENKVDKGYNNLNNVISIIYEALSKGKTIEIEIQGFASPLASDTYNEKLTANRITVIENYFKKWNNGALKSYFESNKISLTARPMGESASKNLGISDKVSDPKNSIFSAAASYERRIEILLINVK